MQSEKDMDDDWTRNRCGRLVPLPWTRRQLVSRRQQERSCAVQRQAMRLAHGVCSSQVERNGVNGAEVGAWG